MVELGDVVRNGNRGLQSIRSTLRALESFSCGLATASDTKKYTSNTASINIKDQNKKNDEIIDNSDWRMLHDSKK